MSESSFRFIWAGTNADHRRFVALRCQGLTTREIAQREGRSEGHIRARICDVAKWLPGVKEKSYTGRINHTCYLLGKMGL